MLDAAEYLHLAIHASSKGDHHAALGYLKEALQQEPKNAKALFLLAAEHAELGLFDRAVTGMQTALELDPNLEMARFQLGLLHLQGNRIDQAKVQFDQLNNSSDPALRAFAEAMVALAQEQPSLAQEKLALGLSRAEHNPSLKSDMQRILDRLLGASTNPIAAQTEVETTSVFLGAYQRAPINDA